MPEKWTRGQAEGAHDVVSVEKGGKLFFFGFEEGFQSPTGLGERVRSYALCASRTARRTEVREEEEEQPPAEEEEEEEVKPTIKVADLNWGSGHFQAEVLKIIIEEGYGYPVELIPGATIFMLQALQTGEVHIIPEIWLPNQQEAWNTAVASGNVLDMGTQTKFANWQSLFVVPTYVIEGDPERGIEPMAPDLKSVFDLEQEQYKELFQNPENPSKGGIYSGQSQYEGNGC